MTKAKEIINKNNLSSVITIIHSNIEKAEINEKVDIIISDWMGYFLLYESRIRQIIFARDKWLKEGGVVYLKFKKILPDKATLYLAGFEDSKFKRNKTNFWDDVYEINMECIKPMVFKDPRIDFCNKKMVNSSTSKLFEIDLYKAKENNLNFSNAYEVTFFRNDTFNGFVVWFDVYFEKLPNKVQFTTGKNTKYV